MTPPLTDGEISLVLKKETPANIVKDWVRAIHFDITLPDEKEPIGQIDLRLGYNMNIVRYGGHIGYGIHPAWRGHHYAGKACQLLKPLAIENGMDVLWITCNPDNWPSRKTCEWVGATLVEVVDFPEDNEQYRKGERQKCRYRWILY